MSQPFFPSIQRRRGFTLTELAIVLGIIGLILGAIWAAAAKVYSNNKVNRSAQQILTVANGMRSLYGTKGVIDTGDLTGLAVNNNLFPPDMIQPSSACFDGVSPCPVHPWNGEMTVGSQEGWGSVPQSRTNFEIAVWQSAVASKSYCAALMGTVVSSGSSAGLVYVSSAAGPLAVNAKTSQTDNLITTCSGDLVFQFSL